MFNGCWWGLFGNGCEATCSCWTKGQWQFCYLVILFMSQNQLCTCSHLRVYEGCMSGSCLCFCWRRTVKHKWWQDTNKRESPFQSLTVYLCWPLVVVSALALRPSQPMRNQTLINMRAKYLPGLSERGVLEDLSAAAAPRTHIKVTEACFSVQTQRYSRAP